MVPVSLPGDPHRDVGAPNMCQSGSTCVPEKPRSVNLQPKHTQGTSLQTYKEKECAARAAQWPKQCSHNRELLGPLLNASWTHLPTVQVYNALKIEPHVELDPLRASANAPCTCQMSPEASDFDVRRDTRPRAWQMSRTWEESRPREARPEDSSIYIYIYTYIYKTYYPIIFQ